VEVWQTSNLRRLRLGEEKKIEDKRKTTGQKYTGLPYSQGRIMTNAGPGAVPTAGPLQTYIST